MIARSGQSGFTLVEVIVTIIASSIFLFGILGLGISSLTISVSTSRRTTADNLSYANLRQYVNGSGARNWFNCNAGSTATLLNSTAGISGLPSPVTQLVTASAPYGCPGVIAVTSKVTYGANNTEFVYAGYEAY
ncbi:MAG: prepilin-type N-terminal cleavage/methylation domain-containing protein [Candidatus Saccharimonas aalborgensis]|jgi:prepilin-type N-terminal cleavage/methylation domain-containing protein